MANTVRISFKMPLIQKELFDRIIKATHKLLAMDVYQLLVKRLDEGEFDNHTFYKYPKKEPSFRIRCKFDKEHYYMLSALCDRYQIKRYELMWNLVTIYMQEVGVQINFKKDAEVLTEGLTPVYDLDNHNDNYNY